MAKSKKENELEVVTTFTANVPEGAVVVPVKKIARIETDFGRTDFNSLRDIVNQLVDIQNGN